MVAEYSLKNRRSSARFKLKLPMIIQAGDVSLPTFAETRDLSVDGFFCSVPLPLAIGERFRCLILLDGAAQSGETCCAVCIEAEAEVVRLVSNRLECGFGVGCCTLNYRVQPTTVWRQAVAECPAA